MLLLVHNLLIKWMAPLPWNMPAICPWQFWEFSFEGLVVENLNAELLAGTLFMEANDISIHPAKHQVILSNGATYLYWSQAPTVVSTTMGPVEPPQHKGLLPQYARNKLVELQEKFNQLEDLGVSKCPEDVSVSVEYLNPFFPVKRSSGGFCVVTAFADVGRYNMSQPSLVADVDSTLCYIPQWKHIVAINLTNALYQNYIPCSWGTAVLQRLSKGFASMYTWWWACLVLRLSLRSSCVASLAPLQQDGVVAKIVDDLYCGGNTLLELLQNWEKVL